MNIIKVMFYFTFCLFSVSSFAYIPPEFESINSSSGWEIFKKTQNGEDVYVQKIDLTKRKLLFVNDTITNNLFPTFKLSEKFVFLNNKNLTQKALSLVNGTFFGYNNSNTVSISYPYQNLNKLLTSGVSTEAEKKNGLKVFKYISFNNIAYIDDYYDGYIENNKTGSYITGINPYFDQGGKKYSKIGRNFIGLQDKTLYILTGKKLTQDEARLNLVDFGVYESNIIMFDGSGSAQLSFKNKSSNYINIYGCALSSPCFSDARKIPQALAVYW